LKAAHEGDLTIIKALLAAGARPCSLSALAAARHGFVEVQREIGPACGKGRSATPGSLFLAAAMGDVEKLFQIGRRLPRTLA
jgi:hypothetical protein